MGCVHQREKHPGGCFESRIINYCTAVRQVRRIVGEYQTLLTSQSKTNAMAIKDRQAFLEDLKTCLVIKDGGIEKVSEDRALTLGTIRSSSNNDGWGLLMIILLDLCFTN